MIIVSEDQTAAMRAHGVRDYPYECCGLMLGKFGAGRKRLSRLSQAFWRLVAASAIAYRFQFCVPFVPAFA